MLPVLLLAAVACSDDNGGDDVPPPSADQHVIIAKTRCDENQNEMRFFEGVNSPKRNVTKISHAHEKHRSNGCRIPFERCFGLEIL